MHYINADSQIIRFKMIIYCHCKTNIKKQNSDESKLTVLRPTVLSKPESVEMCSLGKFVHSDI